VSAIRSLPLCVPRNAAFGMACSTSSSRDGYRFLHATEGAESRSSPIGDGSDAGHLAAVSSGRHPVVQPDGDGEQGQRLDLAPTSRAMSGIGLLAQVHAVLVGMVRSFTSLSPTLICTWLYRKTSWIAPAEREWLLDCCRKLQTFNCWIGVYRRNLEAP